MKYDQILQLLEAWEGFENETKEADLEGFARHILKNRLTTEAASRLAKNYEGMPTEVRLNVLIYRMNRAWEIQTKEIFAESADIGSLSELRILSCVAGKSQPKKNEVISEILLETTTGTMLIQRMVGRGLLTETPDTVDRRALRLDLTEAGKAALSTIGERLFPMIRAFFAPLGEAEQEQIVEWLERLGGGKNG